MKFDFSEHPPTANQTSKVNRFPSQGRGGCSMIWTTTPAHTGRTVTGASKYQLALDWARACDRKDPAASTHPAAREFTDALSAAPRLAVAGRVWFRGRPIDGKPPTSDDMGPPRIEHLIGDGRYNRPGQRVLYLCDSEWGVRCELAVSHTSGTRYVQRYCLPDHLLIADFTNFPDDHLVTAVFSIAEDCNPGDARSVDARSTLTYQFSQIVAELVMEKFKGMCVRGVRGSRGAWYTNAVVFRPDDWCTWLEVNSPPYALDQ